MRSKNPEKAEKREKKNLHQTHRNRFDGCTTLIVRKILCALVHRIIERRRPLTRVNAAYAVFTERFYGPFFIIACETLILAYLIELIYAYSTQVIRRFPFPLTCAAQRAQKQFFS